MAVIYSVPDEIGEFKYEFGKANFDYKHYGRARDRYIAKMAKWCQKNSKTPEAGRVIRFNVADGYAEYMVYSARPCALIHLNGLCDGYAVDPIMERGMNWQDVKERIRKEEALHKLFGKN